MPAGGREAFQYALLRVVPDAARGECLNAGVVLFCRRRDFLPARSLAARGGVRTRSIPILTVVSSSVKLRVCPGFVAFWFLIPP